jgi:hypothetical protein
VGGVSTEMVEHTRRYGPTQRSWRRFEALKLSVDVDPDDLAQCIVRAVIGEKPAVHLPRRGLPYPWLAQAPWRITDLLLLGVDRHTHETNPTGDPGAAT